MENEILKIPQLLRQGKMEEVRKIIETYELDAQTLLQILSDYSLMNRKNCCKNCKHATRRVGVFLFCTVHKRKKTILSKCNLFSAISC